MTLHSPSMQPIESLMTSLPRTVASDTDVREASALMRELGIHHLPVVEAGELVGIVSARDLEVVDAIRTLDRTRMTVAEVLVGEPTTADAREPLVSVIERMSEVASDCCVVLRDGLVVGIVTHEDVVRSFLGLLGAESVRAKPEAVRRRILREHERIRSVLDHMEALAGRVACGDRASASTLRRWTRELAVAVREHLDLEEEILVPAIREVDGFGDARADALLDEHDAQRALLGRVVDDLCGATNDSALAVGVMELIRALRDDIVSEEREFLGALLLDDTVVAADAFGG